MYWEPCKGCRLCGRKPVEPFCQADKPVLAFIGEAPGANEDREGIPFVGAAGKLLDQVLERVGIRREDVYIGNIVRCRPPENKISSNEIQQCFPLLEGSLFQVPSLRTIVAMGNVAMVKLLGFGGSKVSGIKKYRGRVFRTKYGAVIPTYHPAYALRNPGYLEFIEKDLCLAARTVLDEVRETPTYYLCETRKDVDDILDSLFRSNGFAYDCETTGLNPREDLLLGISFSVQEGEAFYIPVRVSSDDRDEVAKYGFAFSFPSDRAYLKSRFEKLFLSTVPKIGHNLKFDAQVIKREFGVWPKAQHFDVMLAAHTLNSEDGPFSLEVLLGRNFPDLVEHKKVVDSYLGDGKVKKGKVEDSQGFLKVPTDKLAVRAGVDADGTLRLGRKLKRQIADEGFSDLYRGICLPFMEGLARAENVGIRVDGGYLLGLVRKTQNDVDVIRSSIQDSTRKFGFEDFNPSSYDQMVELLYEKMDLPRPKRRTAGGNLPTDKETLMGIVVQRDVPEEYKKILVDLVSYAQVSHIKSTFVDGFARRVGDDGVMYPNWLQHGTRAGRISCSDPNLMNIPRDSESNPWAGLIKRMFIARPGRVFILGDFSQIELRMGAYITGDPVMIRAYRNREDLHSSTAASLFQVALEQVQKAQRHIGKTVNFSMFYRISPAGLYITIVFADPRPKRILEMMGRYTVVDCAKFIKGFYDLYRNVGPWMSRTIKSARSQGYITTYFGRRRHIYGLDSNDSETRAYAENQAVNSTIQGSAADITNRAFGRISREISPQIAYPLLHVHDMIGVESVETEAEAVKQQMREIMTDPCGRLGSVVPIEVDLKVSDRWE